MPLVRYIIFLNLHKNISEPCEYIIMKCNNEYIIMNIIIMNMNNENNNEVRAEFSLNLANFLTNNKYIKFVKKIYFFI